MPLHAGGQQGGPAGGSDGVPASSSIVLITKSDRWACLTVKKYIFRVLGLPSSGYGVTKSDHDQ